MAPSSVDHPLLWHEGTTRGFSAYFGMSPATGTSVFLLVNATPAGRRQLPLRALGDRLAYHTDG